MLRPIEADGTCRYSTGRPGRENAPAVAAPPTRPTSPGSAAAATAATVSRRTQQRIFLLTSVINLGPLSYANRALPQNVPCGSPYVDQDAKVSRFGIGPGHLR